MPAVEVASLSLSIVMIVGYHIWLVARIRNAPQSTWYAQAARARSDWVCSMMSERRDIVAVQTLRSWSMGASFLASTAVIVIMGLLGVVLTSDRLPALIHNLNIVGSTEGSLMTFKILAVVSCLLFAFVNFTVAIRYFNHVSIDINVPQSTASVTTVETVCILLNRAAMHYTLGMRGFYFALPIVLWLFGPLWMALGSMFLCLGLFHLDRSIAYPIQP